MAQSVAEKGSARLCWGRGKQSVHEGLTPSSVFSVFFIVYHWLLCAHQASSQNSGPHAVKGRTWNEEAPIDVEPGSKGRMDLSLRDAQGELAVIAELYSDINSQRDDKPLHLFAHGNNALLEKAEDALPLLGLTLMTGQYTVTITVYGMARIAGAHGYTRPLARLTCSQDPGQSKTYRLQLAVLRCVRVVAARPSAALRRGCTSCAAVALERHVCGGSPA